MIFSDETLPDSLDRISQADNPMQQADQEIIRWWNERVTNGKNLDLRKARVKILSALTDVDVHQQRFVFIYNLETGELALLDAPAEIISSECTILSLQPIVKKVLIENGLEWPFWNATFIDPEDKPLGWTTSEI